MLLRPSCQTACLLHSQHCYEVLRYETRWKFHRRARSMDRWERHRRKPNRCIWRYQFSRWISFLQSQGTWVQYCGTLHTQRSRVMTGTQYHFIYLFVPAGWIKKKTEKLGRSHCTISNLPAVLLSFASFCRTGWCTHRLNVVRFLLYWLILGPRVQGFMVLISSCWMMDKKQTGFPPLWACVFLACDSPYLLYCF